MSSPDPALINVVPPVNGGGGSINVTIRTDKYGQASLGTPFSATGCVLNVTLVLSTGFPTRGQTFDIILDPSIVGAATPGSPLPFPFTQSIVAISTYKALRLTYTG